MNVIVFASRKGGSGKSTLTAHLAAHVHKPSRPCLLVDADPQGSLTLWHKLRGTNEPPLKTANRSVSEIVASAKRAANSNGDGLADSDRYHEGQRGELQGNGVGRNRRCAYPAH